MSDEVRAAAERLVNATDLADDSLTDFEADVKTVARYALAATARPASTVDPRDAEIERLKVTVDMLRRLLHREHFFDAGRLGFEPPFWGEHCPPCEAVDEELATLPGSPGRG